MVTFSNFFSSFGENIEIWWGELPSDTKWKILGTLIAIVIVIWIVLKALAFITKAILTIAVVGGVLLLIIDQTGNMSFWIMAFPMWEDYEIWEKAGLICVVGLIIVITLFALKKIAKKTLFAPNYDGKNSKKMTVKQCEKKGGSFNFKTKTCNF